jgi:hypothetical protein
MTISPMEEPLLEDTKIEELPERQRLKAMPKEGFSIEDDSTRSMVEGQKSTGPRRF